ncbi:hypothetical protein SADUNF_Sadunf04G0000800 [Salix dunnii]|uniref:Uncharacterized protein n=1 Tax=Salix dunnii TaxID=1413687 RepID=A0A835N2I0_9ROSI|nr:hypothetical protein SADUNF_Sadunf04G0000800 [Salix dunnii]
MEGVGARLGRSSTRYGPTTVFSGPVRKWKKRWVHVNPSSNHNSFHSHHHNATTNAAAAASSSATNHSSSSNGNNGSHLLLYKWTPLSQSNGSSSTTNHYNGTNINTTNENANLSNGDVTEEPPRRKFKYIPCLLLSLGFCFRSLTNREILEKLLNWISKLQFSVTLGQCGLGTERFASDPKRFSLVMGRLTMLDSVNYPTGSYSYKAFRGCNWYKKTCMSLTPVKPNTIGYLVDLIERQKKEAEEQEEASEKFDDESKPSDSEPHAAEPVSKSDSADEKPDINDVAMEENQVNGY